MQKSPDVNDCQEGSEISSQDMITAVRELVALMRESGMAELDIETQALSVRLRAAQQVTAAHETVVVQNSPIATPQPIEDPGHVVTSPMIGTFYSAPAPGEAPFAEVGDEVEVGQVIGIVEAMKIMNEIIADRAGVVDDILVDNAQAVEYGSPLVRLIDQTDALM